MMGPIPDEYWKPTIESMYEEYGRTNMELKDILDPHFSIPKNAVVKPIYSEADYVAVLYENRIYVVDSKILMKFVFDSLEHVY